MNLNIKQSGKCLERNAQRNVSWLRSGPVNVHKASVQQITQTWNDAKICPPVALQQVLNLTIEHLQHYFWMSHDFISVLNYQAYPFLYHPVITDVNQTLALAPDPPKQEGEQQKLKQIGWCVWGEWEWGTSLTYYSLFRPAGALT